MRDLWQRMSDAWCGQDAAIGGWLRLAKRGLCTVAVQVVAGPWVLALLKVLAFSVLLLIFPIGRDGPLLLEPSTFLRIGVTHAYRWFGVFLAIGLWMALLELLFLPFRQRLRDRRGRIVAEAAFFVAGAAAWAVLAPSGMIGFAVPAAATGPEAAIAFVLGGIATLICRRIDATVYGLVGRWMADPFEEMEERDGWIAKPRELSTHE